LNFFGARIVTMVIEMVGVGIFVDGLNFNEMGSKIVIQFVVLILN
ncbi:MAG TPA: GtrA family protein, partial [Lachnospiraceae bacterium]|nr:GtrA family protein [Lachnospiraceae bacterium]